MLSRFVAACFGILAAVVPALAVGDEWMPIDVSDPSLKSPVVERNADAEAIFWDVYLDDGAKEGLVFYHYLRIKIFTDRGRESQSKIDILYSSNYKIESVAARTIKPDGLITELRKEDVFDRTIVKVNGAKVKAKSFTFPAVEAGAIIEYRWREIRPGRFAHYIRLPFQRDIPTRQVTYHFRPITGIKAPMRLAYFNMPPVDLVAERGFFFKSTMTNVPAFREEPYMPPESEVRPWMLVYYARPGKVTKETFWQNLGKEVYDLFSGHMKVNEEIRKTAVEATGDAAAPEEKLQRIFEYCRAKIKNINSGDSEMTAEERANRKENKTPADTLKHGEGNGFEINMLFGALASASGFDARVALMPDRGDAFFHRNLADPYFLRLISIAVKVGDRWRFFDPGTAYVSWDMLPWQEEGDSALVSGPDNAGLQLTPLSAPEKSKKLRTARLRLDEDGTLEGDARVEYTGHLAVQKKARNDQDSPTQREQTLRDEFKAQMSTAELSDIRIDNITDGLKPVVYSFHIRVPGYGLRTGKRVFLQPSFFQHGLDSIFTASERKHDIYFRFPWSEEDEITIELPAGYEVDSLDPMEATTMGAIGEYKASVDFKKDKRAVVYRRSFAFGSGGTTLFPNYQYQQLKGYFNLLHQRDGYTIVLKQAVAAAFPNQESKRRSID